MTNVRIIGNDITGRQIRVNQGAIDIIRPMPQVPGIGEYIALDGIDVAGKFSPRHEQLFRVTKVVHSVYAGRDDGPGSVIYVENAN